MDFVSLSRCPEFLYASRRFESFFRPVLNGIERKHQECGFSLLHFCEPWPNLFCQKVLHVKRIELLEEVIHLGILGLAAYLDRKKK